MSNKASRATQPTKTRTHRATHLGPPGSESLKLDNFLRLFNSSSHSDDLTRDIRIRESREFRNFREFRELREFRDFTRSVNSMHGGSD